MTSDRPGPAEYAAIFEDDARGAALIEDLVLRFAQPPVTKGGIDAILQTYERAGARKVLDFVVLMINRSHGVDDPQPEGETDA